MAEILTQTRPNPATKQPIAWLLASIFAMLLLVSGIWGLVSPVQASKSEKRVAVLLSSDTNLYAQGLAGIQSSLESPTDIQYLDLLSLDEKELNQYWATINQAQYPLLIAIGKQAAESAITHTRGIPVIVSMVNAPRFLLKGENSCGIGLDVPLRPYFATIKEIRPKATRVVSFYSTTEGEFLSREGTYYDYEFQLRYTPYQVSPDENWQDVLEERLKNADAFYMVPDAIYTPAHFQSLSEYAKKHKIILMTPFPSLVRSGSLFGFNADYGDLGVQTGRLAEEILSGKLSCKEAGSRLPSHYLFTLNEGFAKEAGIAVPESIRSRAHLSNLTKAAIQLFYQNRYKPARKVFGYILKRDPENQMVLYYRDLLIEKQTGKETRRLLKEADSLFEKKAFPAARQKYASILRLNPHHRAAKEGLTKSIRAQSEEEYKRALALERQGKAFLAIKQAQAAIRTLPSNQKAQATLTSIRNRMQSKVPQLMQEGIDSYNQRNYAKSIKLFENILLVRPGSKKAIEYLRLSKKKKAAIERMIRSGR